MYLNDWLSPTSLISSTLMTCLTQPHCSPSTPLMTSSLGSHQLSTIRYPMTHSSTLWGPSRHTLYLYIIYPLFSPPFALSFIIFHSSTPWDPSRHMYLSDWLSPTLPWSLNDPRYPKEAPRYVVFRFIWWILLCTYIPLHVTHLLNHPHYLQDEEQICIMIHSYDIPPCVLYLPPCLIISCSQDSQGDLHSNKSNNKGGPLPLLTLWHTPLSYYLFLFVLLSHIIPYHRTLKATFTAISPIVRAAFV